MFRFATTVQPKLRGLFFSLPQPAEVYPILGYPASPAMIRVMPKRHSLTEQARLQDLLRKIRLDAGLTQADLAARLGQPQSFVSKYESGERRLDVLELRAVCRIAGVSLGEFARKLEQLLK